MKFTRAHLNEKGTSLYYLCSWISLKSILAKETEKFQQIQTEPQLRSLVKGLRIPEIVLVILVSPQDPVEEDSSTGMTQEIPESIKYSCIHQTYELKVDVKR